MTEAGGVLLIFSKAPVPGYVKKRLIPSLGENTAACLYSSLLRNTLQTARRSRFSAIELHCAPTIEHSFFKDCESEFDVVLRQQQGRDLGERMYTALSSALKEYPFAVIIGCDCPGLTENLLNDVYLLLKDGSRIVLGPCEDGGYFLIGARMADGMLFDKIAWGTDDVLESTRERLRILGENWHETDVLWDVDRPRDYDRLRLCNPSLCP